MNTLNDLPKQHSTLQTQPKHKQIGITNVKTKIISKILLTLGLVFALRQRDHARAWWHSTKLCF